MKTLTTFTIALTLMFAGFLMAAPATPLEIAEDSTLIITEAPAVDGTLTINAVTLAKANTCKTIEAHAPVDEGATFKTDVGKVWVYSKFTMDKDVTSTIKHVYYYKDKLISTVELDVKGTSFRTNSYKTITKNMVGDWKVEITAENGEIYETLNFTIIE